MNINTGYLLDYEKKLEYQAYIKHAHVNQFTGPQIP